MTTLIRRIAFSSGHRYWHPDLSADENRARYGRWASPYNHGHNYTLWVAAKGAVDPANGMVVNIKWIDDVLKERVIARFDQRSINDEVPPFDRVAPSVENLLAYFANDLKELPGGVELTGLKLEETPLLYGEWSKDDEGQTMITLTRIYEFAASHRLNAPQLDEAENVRLFGKCNRIHGHGHNYILEVTVNATPDPATGFSVSIDEVDEVVNREIVDRYDHYNLDIDVPELQGLNTTSEVVAQVIFNRLVAAVPGQLVRVRLHETARNIFEVTSAAPMGAAH